jgi:hypothetical protein
VKASRLKAYVVIPFLLVLAAFWLVSCDDSQGGQVSDGTTSSSIKSTEQSGDVKGVLGEKVQVGDAVITVRALQATFQPAMPTQRLSESTPAAPGPGESFYQAYVRIENTEATPLRIDPNDFACHIGDKVVGIEPTRSGPYARSLLKNTSLDLVLTFKGPAGYQAELLYNPPWYHGVISIGLENEGESTTTTAVE